MRPRTLLSIAIALPLLASGALSYQAGSPARIDLERGRALLVDGVGVSALKSHAGPYLVAGNGHLELAPGARAVLRWPGRASLELDGPTSVSWRSPDEGGPFHWTFTALHSADLEIRGQGARIDLPDAWRVHLGRGAYSIYGLPGGGVELEHRAGEAAHALWVGGERAAPPPIPVAPGTSLRLAGVPSVVSAPDRTGTAPRWSATEWPWGDGGVPNFPDLTSACQSPWNTHRWPWGVEKMEIDPWEQWDWPWVLRTEVTELIEAPPDPDEESKGERVAPAPLTIEPGGEDLPPPEPYGSGACSPVYGECEVLFSPLEPSNPVEPVGGAEESVGAAPASPDLRRWRGLTEEATEAHLGFRLQRNPGWSLEELPSGRLRVQLDRESPEPAWYFGPEFDYRVFPGSALTMEPDGSVRFHQGVVRILGK
jgi:hypothetical protein